MSKGNGKPPGVIPGFSGPVPLVGRAGQPPEYPIPCPSGLPVEQKVTVEVEIEGRTIPVTVNVVIPTSVHLQVIYAEGGRMSYRLCNVCRGRGLVMAATPHLLQLAQTLAPIETAIAQEIEAVRKAREEIIHAGKETQEGS